MTLILVLTLHPEIQKKAQEELDRVVGHERLPGLKDCEDLPYIEAVCAECFR
jgi:cytochrome P450